MSSDTPASAPAAASGAAAETPEEVGASLERSDTPTRAMLEKLRVSDGADDEGLDTPRAKADAKAAGGGDRKRAGSSGVPRPRDRAGSAAPSPKDFLYGTELGEGAYARVLHCRHRGSKKDFAAKVMEKRFIRREDKVHTVIMERKVLSSVNHPNIVKLLYTFQDSEYLYMMMELCRGGDLRHTISKAAKEHRGRALDLEATRWYTAHMLAALEYLHFKCHVIHRDMKPENVLITSTGHVKLTDFGTAKDESKDSGKEDDFAGTAEYVSPEVLRDEPASREVDLWAIGCIVYQCITGRPPFRGESEYLTFQQILNYPDTHSLDFPESMPEEARDFINALLKSNPKERLGSGEPGSDLSFDSLKAHRFFGPDGMDALLAVDPPIVPAVKELPEPRANTVDDLDDLAPIVLKHNRRMSVKDILTAGETTALRAESGGGGAADGGVGAAGAGGTGLEYWREHLEAGEAPILWGVIDKRKGLFSKTRELILTTQPRLVYFDPETTELKGHIPWSSTMSVKVKDAAGGVFDVITPGRTYHITDASGGAARWKAAIEKQLATSS